MPQPKNTLLRAIIPIVLILLGIGVAAAVFVNSRKQGTAGAAGKQGATGATGPTGPAAGTGASAASGPSGSTGSEVPGQAGATGAPTASGTSGLEGVPGATGASGPTGATGGRGLHPQVFAAPDKIGDFDPIGSADPKSPEEAFVEFSTLGAGVKSISLTHQSKSITDKSPTVAQHEYGYTPPVSDADPRPPTVIVTPMAANAVEIDGEVVPLLGYTNDPNKGVLGSPVWRQTSPGAFEAIVLDGQSHPVARVERAYTLAAGTYDLRLVQRVINLGSAPMRVRWHQFGPVDLDQDNLSYGGDRRRVRFGYLFKPQAQGNDPTVLGDEFIWPRSTALGPQAKNGSYEDVRAIWPNPTSESRGFRMVWLGLCNRYFGAALHPLVKADATPEQKVFSAAATVDRVLLHRFVPKGGGLGYDPVMIVRTSSVEMTVAPGAAADLSMGLYAGPLSRPVIDSEPEPAAVGLGGLVVYNYGGMCGWCTFGFLTGTLLWLLRIFANYVVFDWGLAIVLLVLLVRTLLHPVTKWSQIRMARFGKQMQEMAPKQKKIQEKYKDDPDQLRKEMARLWREEGISPTGFLGCLPGFIQSPVWIALSSMLFFAFDLRHTPAFFGVFQRISGGKWHFLADLAEPDRFVDFGRTIFTIPLLNAAVQSINLLPVLLGVVFFIQQKYLTPPTTTQLTPEQEQQQKMMKVLMVLMFPLMMYSAPSGLALYFICNSTLAILESRYIRSHINKYDLLNPPKRPGGGFGGFGGFGNKPGGPGPKPGGFMDRLRQLAEQRQREMLKARGQPPRKKV